MLPANCCEGEADALVQALQRETQHHLTAAWDVRRKRTWGNGIRICGLGDAGLAPHGHPRNHVRAAGAGRGAGRRPRARARRRLRSFVDRAGSRRVRRIPRSDFCGPEGEPQALGSRYLSILLTDSRCDDARSRQTSSPMLWGSHNRYQTAQGAGLICGSSRTGIASWSQSSRRGVWAFSCRTSEGRGDAPRRFKLVRKELRMREGISYPRMLYYNLLPKLSKEEARICPWASQHFTA